MQIPGQIWVQINSSASLAFVALHGLSRALDLVFSALDQKVFRSRVMELASGIGATGWAFEHKVSYACEGLAAAFRRNGFFSPGTLEAA